MLAPEAVLLAAALGAVAALSDSVTLTAAAAAGLCATVYLRRLLELARVGADQRTPPVTPSQALRSELPRCLGSVAVRAVAVTLLALLAGLDAVRAALVGPAAGFAIGWVQLVRQVAIVRTFRE